MHLLLLRIPTRRDLQRERERIPVNSRKKTKSNSIELLFELMNSREFTVVFIDENRKEFDIPTVFTFCIFQHWPLQNEEGFFIGRSRAFGIKDHRVSKNQLHVLHRNPSDDYCIVTMVFHSIPSTSTQIKKKGRNPSSIKRNDAEKRVLMEKNTQFAVYKGDELCLLAIYYPFKVKIKEKKPPGTLQQRS
jgi:hypothetical protein